MFHELLWTKREERIRNIIVKELSEALQDIRTKVYALEEAAAKAKVEEQGAKTKVGEEAAAKAAEEDAAQAKAAEDVAGKAKREEEVAAQSRASDEAAAKAKAEKEPAGKETSNFRPWGERRVLEEAPLPPIESIKSLDSVVRDSVARDDRERSTIPSPPPMQPIAPIRHERPTAPFELPTPRSRGLVKRTPRARNIHANSSAADDNRYFPASTQLPATTVPITPSPRHAEPLHVVMEQRFEEREQMQYVQKKAEILRRKRDIAVGAHVPGTLNDFFDACKAQPQLQPHDQTGVAPALPTPKERNSNAAKIKSKSKANKVAKKGKRVIKLQTLAEKLELEAGWRKLK